MASVQGIKPRFRISWRGESSTSINKKKPHAKVIGRGVSLWVEGKQKTPWANYIFEPELQVDEYPDDEILQEFYDNNPDMEFDLHKLNNLSRELDEKLKKEESKNDGK